MASVKAVLRIKIPTLSRSRPDTGRPVVHRQLMTPTIQARAAIRAAGMLKIASIAANNTAGATTAVPRLTATRTMTSRRPVTSGRARGTDGTLAMLRGCLDGKDGLVLVAFGLTFVLTRLHCEVDALFVISRPRAAMTQAAALSRADVTS